MCLRDRWWPARHTVTRWRAAPWHRVTFVTLMPLLTPAIMTSNLTSAGTLAQYEPACSLSPVLQTVQPDTLTLQFYSFGLKVYHWTFQADICDSADVNIQHTDYEAGVKILCCSCMFCEMNGQVDICVFLRNHVYSDKNIIIYVMLQWHINQECNMNGTEWNLSGNLFKFDFNTHLLDA